MHQDLDIKENGLPICWREGAVLKLQNSRVLIVVRTNERQIEIRIKGGNARGALEVICYHLDHINSSIKKIKFSKKIPCNCSENCSYRYIYEDLLQAEIDSVETIQCHKSFKYISISSLLDGYIKKEKRFREYDEFSARGPIFIINPTAQASSQANSITQVEQKTKVITNINLDLEIDLPQIQIEFDKLKEEMENLDPKLEQELDKIQDSLDEVSSGSEKESLKKPLNKLHRLLDKLADPDSNYNKVITGTQKGVEHAQKLGRTYNKFAQWLAMPQVPDLFLGQ